MEVKEKMIVKHVSFGYGIIEKIISKNTIFVHFENEETFRIFSKESLNNPQYFKNIESLSINDIFKKKLLDNLLTETQKTYGILLFEKDKVLLKKSNNDNEVLSYVDSNIVNISLNDGNTLITKCTCNHSFCKHMYATILYCRSNIDLISSGQNLSSSSSLDSLIYDTIFYSKGSSYYENIYKIIDMIKDENDFKFYCKLINKYCKSYNSKIVTRLFEITIYSKKVNDFISKIGISNLPSSIIPTILSVSQQHIYMLNAKNYPFYCLINEDIRALNDYFSLSDKKISTELRDCFFGFLIINNINDDVNLDVLSQLIKIFYSYQFLDIIRKIKNPMVKKILMLNYDISLTVDDLALFNVDELKELFLRYKQNNIYELLESCKNKLDYNDEQWVQVYYKIYYSAPSKYRKKIIKKLSLIKDTQYIIELLENNSYESEAEIYENRRYFY